MIHDTRSRVPVNLRKALQAEVEALTEGMTFRQPDSEERAAMKVFGQALPVPPRKAGTTTEASIDYVEEEQEDAIFQCPWCMVKIDGGEANGPNADVTVNVAVCFGIFDDSLDNDGSDDVLNLIEKVYQRFARDPVLAHQYICQQDFEWGLQDEDTWPYFFGAIGMSFSYMGIQRESKYT